MADSLRERDDEVRALMEDLRDVRGERDAAVRKDKEWGARWTHRTNDMEVRLFQFIMSESRLTSHARAVLYFLA